jgi:hypothetical protein
MIPAAVILVLAGCDTVSKPTPHERFIAVIATFDDENAKLYRLASAAEVVSKDAAPRAFESIHGRKPTDREMMVFKEAMSSRSSSPEVRAYLELYNHIPEIVAVRRQSMRVEQLRKEAAKARTDWLKSESK